MKVESDQGEFEDDTALNAISLKCFDKKNNYIESVSSYEGGAGEWQPRQSCNDTNNFLNGIRLRSEEVNVIVILL